MLGAIPLIFLILNCVGYGKRARGIGVLCSLGVLALIYTEPALADSLRWGLTIVAFAAPLALSVIAIEYLVEET